MGTIIDESDEIDLEAEWADRVVNSSLSPRRRKAAQRKLILRRRIEEYEEKRRMKALLEGYDPQLFDRL